jgi:hypothetical protein
MVYFIKKNHTIYFSKTIPKETVLFQATIQLREPLCDTQHFTIVSCDPKSNPLVPNHSYVYHDGILKSNLQKTFRGKFVDACLATGLQYLYQDPQSFLRRMTVIFLEDSLYHHYYYPYYVWMMIAQSKGYTLSHHDIQILMNGLATNLECPSCYFLWGSVPQRKEKCRVPFISMMLRSLYGGMECDQGFLYLLAYRSLYETNFPTYNENYHVDLSSISNFVPKKHVCVHAIDFHVFPKILKTLNHITPKEAIWNHWSNINQRTFVGLCCDEASQKRVSDWEETLFDFENGAEILQEHASKKILWMEVTKEEWKKPPPMQKTLLHWFQKV